MKDINILITSAGRRVQLIKYFQDELKGIGEVIITDCSNIAPAMYMGGKVYIIPTIDDSNYINELKDICKKEKVKGIISLIDPELSILALHKGEFEEIGVQLFLSEVEVLDICFDKFKMFQFLQENNFKTAMTFEDFDSFMTSLNKGTISFPVFVKPRKGSASIGISKVENIDELKLLMTSRKDLLIQEYMDGQEYGVDAYVDIVSGEVISIFIKKKLSMRAGETDKAVSIKDEELLDLITDFIKKLGVVAQIDIDIFRVNGEFYISEVNPRFGGGYLIAYECGANFPKYIINNINGIANEPNIGNYTEDMYMLRHDVVTMKHTDELI